ncbi:WD40 repeat domain-containing protein [Actinoplanes sp. NBRC 101535]|uniref:WD40 repeat domain-containing protein n=1 Tax=Actinoplanes sp. NBRC 101535 TaxID=3032196 RepID=UPI00249FB6C2|nr:WD40 repeat domain-containing protein [Actinoplanes sp. NBRC 101535]GLY02956.1 hypothetical protein Acsp01_33350 [Actinoplanes sp. NBRC 101535]
MRDENGWVQYYDQERERVPADHLGGFEPESILVDGTVVLFGGRCDDRLPLRAFDRDSGMSLPDRAGLHGDRPPRAMALGRCGERTLLATASAGGVVRVRDAVTGIPVGAEIRHERTGVSVAVTTVVDPDGGGVDVVAVAGSAWIKAWRVDDGEQVASRGYRGVRFVAYQGRLLAAQAKGSGREVRDVLTGKVVGRLFSVPPDLVWTITEIDGRLLVIGVHAETGAPWAWDVLAGVPVAHPPLAVLPQDAGQITAITVADDLTTLLTWYTEDGDVGAGCWRTGPDGPVPSPVPFGTGTITDVALGGGLIAQAGTRNRLTVHRAATGEPVVSPFYGGPVQPPAGVTTLGGRTVAVLPGDPMMLWDVAAGRPVARVDAGVDDVHRIGVDGQGTAAVLYPSDGEKPRLRILDLATGQVRADVPLESQYAGLIPAPVLFDHGGRQVVAIATQNPESDDAIVLYDAATGDRIPGTFGKPFKELPPGSGMPVHLYSVLTTGRVGGRQIVAAGADFGSEVRLWDAATGETLLRIQAGGMGVAAIALGDHHGRPIVATATSTYPRLQVWDATTGKQLRKGIDMSRRVNPMKATALTIASWRGQTVVLAAAPDWPPFMWVVE